RPPDGQGARGPIPAADEATLRAQGGQIAVRPAGSERDGEQHDEEEPGRVPTLGRHRTPQAGDAPAVPRSQPHAGARQDGGSRLSLLIPFSELSPFLGPFPGRRGTPGVEAGPRAVPGRSWVHLARKPRKREAMAEAPAFRADT